MEKEPMVFEIPFGRKLVLLAVLCVVLVFALGVTIGFMSREDPILVAELYSDLAAQAAVLERYESDIKELEGYVDSLPRVAQDRFEPVFAEKWRGFAELAGEYNRIHVALSYRFSHRSGLPPGATKTLPREFKTFRVPAGKDIQAGIQVGPRGMSSRASSFYGDFYISA